MLNNAVEVEDLTVIRGNHRAITDLTLAVPAGSITGLLGPSGCGKTTLIRSIAGSQVIHGGAVTVLGEPAGSAANRARVGYVTQASSVYPDLTIGQNLAYFAAMAGDRAGSVDQALDEVGLRERRGDLTGNLSGGQRTRVSLAAALIAHPDVYLLDEPTVGLDPVLRRDLWELFRGLAAQGRTLVVSSHVMDEAGRCDRVQLLRDGRLIADTTPDGLRSDAGTDDLEQAFLRLAERSAA
ncbi:MAG: ABC transporter ATP-binding protein [Aeromicrobium sp.]|jgi:ABC-2 type transport system ATP-binding protein